MMVRLLVALILLLMPVIIYGQPGDPGGDPDVPITGIEILIALGGLLGIRKLFSRADKPK